MGEINQLKSDEGFKDKIYFCTEGKQTIGYGFNLEAGITQREAEALLTLRVSDIRDKLYAMMHWYKSLPEDIQDVLLNMAYQLGVSGLLNFTKTLDAASKGHWHTMADEMLDSRWANQTPERARRLAYRVRGQL